MDAFFATSPVSMGYLHGLREDAHERFLVLAINAEGACRLICPALSASQAARVGIQDIRSWKDGESPLAHLSILAKDWKLDSAIIAVDDTMTAQTLLACQFTLPAALFKAGGEVLSSLMRVKGAEEIEIMRRAGDIADKAFHDVWPKLKPGLTELEVAEMLKNAMAERGGAPFFSIVAAGPASAEPHHLTDATTLKENEIVLLDFGCEIDGYKSDITRTVFIGKAPEKTKEVYRVVHNAQAAARDAVKAGVTGADVDKAARQVIEDAGYGEYFVHRTGHGIGLRGHEDPYIVATNHEPLGVGNCFSIEPGIYLPGEFGVRIETIVVATKDGLDPLNEEPSPELLEIGV
jgi:Xaa-Pro dipeptidase